ncbi:MAG: ribose-phosphate pyrophosphokinase [Negativicutes bacterium]|jgi:ribose-phosphate pyrophosphokinase|nr:ribose-phosphate pyrophosphokinase [Negativicutes bacterium]MBP8629038.1 ribose-phosphate pyrophosphokinase [Negativicutes bacterium]MBP9536633.1 ribose-phosphate pyrophosphokinase [Negativicutes bacterium]MBP9948516.1 ribose-phosphate pyrophosphokinase [Negativicutes bacterium]
MTLANSDRIRIFTGNANPQLAKNIAKCLNIPLGNAYVGHFNNGETQVMIDESVRGKEVFIVQPTCQPVNDSLMELLIMIDACKRASAKNIAVVIPYYAYARQDRKTRGREPISAKLVADLLTRAGASRVITMDLHAGQIQGFFDIPLDNLLGVPILSDYIETKGLKDIVVVSPDLGGVTRARQLADRLEAPIAIIEKRRPMPGVAEVMNLIGSIEGKTAVIVDDIVDTAGSLVEGAKALGKFGAKEVYACCTHAILSDPAIARVEASNIKELIITDTIPLAEEKKSSKIKILSVAPVFAEAIELIYGQKSVSKLFR